MLNGGTLASSPSTAQSVPMMSPEMPADPRLLPATPFVRLVRTQALSAVGDACLAASLAGSLFFEGTTSGARSKVFLYLLLTMAPFAVVAPVIGPALDRVRGGRRLLMVLSLLARAGLCFAMSRYITKPAPEGLLIYPLAFTVLVLAKGSSIAKSALVPLLVDRDDELVRANARLSLTTSIAAAAAGPPALGVQALFGADWSLLLAMVTYGIGGVVATRIPRVEPVRSNEERGREQEELRQPSILLAGSAMSTLRGAVGFLVSFAAFAFRDDKPALAVVAILGIVGGVCGMIAAPPLRQRVREEVILASALGVAAAASVVGALVGSTIGFALASFAIGIGASGGRPAFDSLLQRDAPDTVRGRAFARFETQFQLVWVLGALLGLIPLGRIAGLVGLGAALGFTAVSYVAALRAVGHGRPLRTTVLPDSVDQPLHRARDRVRTRLYRRVTRRGNRARSFAPRPEDPETRGRPDHEIGEPPTEPEDT
jgi:Major Facilitator Superfamily